jgi:hypothetical protein
MNARAGGKLENLTQKISSARLSGQTRQPGIPRGPPARQAPSRPSDAPPCAPLILRVSVADDTDTAATAADTQAAVCNYFTYEADLLARQHRRNRGRMARWLTVGLLMMTLLLALHSVVGRLYPDSLFKDIVGEVELVHDS